MTKRESYASPGTAMRRNGAGDVRWRRVQAACEMRGNSTTLSRAGFCSARACSSISAAVSTQLPQQAPQPERSEEHTSELQSLMRNSYAVFCLKQKKTTLKLNATIRQSH